MWGQIIIGHRIAHYGGVQLLSQLPAPQPPGPTRAVGKAVYETATAVWVTSESLASLILHVCRCFFAQ